MQGAEKKDGSGQAEGAFIGKADGASPKGSTLSERDDGARSRRARSLECSKIQTSMPGVWAPPQPQHYSSPRRWWATQSSDCLQPGSLSHGASACLSIYLPQP